MTPDSVLLKTSLIRFNYCLVVLVASICLLLNGCGSGSSSRYKLKNDRGPDSERTITAGEPAPRVLPKGKRGNKSPYTVRGKRYWVMDSSQDYKEEGTASWYGKKFHGYETSNGEIYDMYAYTAAHKSLPLPVYVRVTNLENGRKVIVKVNDRGPFHGNRLIDLSYAAAKKLGYHNKGTARVRIEAYPFHDSPAPHRVAGLVPVPNTPNVSNKQADITKFILQVGAYSERLTAVSRMNHVSSLVDAPVFIENSQENAGVFRVRVGPFVDKPEAEYILRLLRSAAYPDSILLHENLAK